MAFEPPDPVTASFQAEKSRIRQLALSGATRLLAEIVNGPNDETAAEWIGAWAPTRGAAPAQVAALTDAYVDAFLEAHGIAVDPNAALDPEEIVGMVRPGVSSEEIAERPLKTIRQALSEGALLNQALDQGRRRLENIVATDVQQAFRLAFHERAANTPGIRAYRRVLHGGENCALCVVASAQRYRTDRLMPIHPGCDCGVEPIVGPSGRTIDQDRLDELKGLLAEEDRAYGDRVEMANTKIRLNVKSIDDVTEVPHGELGPILSVKSHRNIEISDLPSWVRRSRREFDVTGRLVRS